MKEGPPEVLKSPTGQEIHLPEARDFSHEKRFHYTYIPIAQTLVLLVADGSSPYQRPTLDVGLYRNLHTVACSMKTGPT